MYLRSLAQLKCRVITPARVCVACVLGLLCVYAISMPSQSATSAGILSNKVLLPLVTKPNHPPVIPSNPFPADKATNVPQNSILSWEGGDPDGDVVYYRVSFIYIDENHIGWWTHIDNCREITSTSCDPGPLTESHYYWTVAAKDSHGASLQGPTWEFNTEPPPVTDWFVATWGSNDTNCTSPYTPCRTIRAAIRKATSGGTVHVASGTYEERIQLEEGVAVIGAGAGTTTIDAGGAMYAVSCDANSRIEGFTITGATQAGGLSGMGIYCANDAPGIKISNNVITGNIYGIALIGSSAEVSFNRVIANEEYGIVLGNNSTANVHHNIVAQAPQGIKAQITSGVIYNNVIAYTDTALWVNGPATVSNNIVYGADTGIHCPQQPYPAVTYNDIWDSATKFDNCSPGTGNIEVNPMFVDSSHHDYHLRRCSPAIDAGDPTAPYANEPQPNGNRINMGAYGNTAEATISVCP